MLQLGEMIVVLIVILLMYRPLLWLAKKLVLRAVTVWNNLDKGIVQFGNVVTGDMAGGDIHKACGCGKKGCTDIPELTPEDLSRAKTRKEKDAEKKKE